MSDKPTGSEIEHPWPRLRIVYASQYNISFFGFERLHPFDGRKYGRAWKFLRNQFGKSLDPFWIKPAQPATHAQLLEIHTEEYLQQLRKSAFVARVLEIPLVRRLPNWLIDWIVLRPMRWATIGTTIAAREAMKHGLAINMSGGYHHASHNDGLGFSAYADIGLAIQQLRKEKLLSETGKVAYIDLDAHQGNGVCRTFFDDNRVFIYDQYNLHIFPMDVKAQRRIDCDVPIAGGTHGADYLVTLRKRLPIFLDSICRGGEVQLGIYNAGTDIFMEDQLGGLNLSAAQVLERDQFVLDQLIDRKIPAVALLSGGYSAQSYQLVAAMVADVLEKWGHSARRI